MIMMTLKQRLINDVLTILFPTFLIVLVRSRRINYPKICMHEYFSVQLSFTTNWYGPYEFKPSVGVNLTALLVNVTLYMSVSKRYLETLFKNCFSNG